MRYLDLWRIKEDSYLQISPAVLDIFGKYAQVNCELPESGGILLGYVRGNHLDIVEATEPTKNDKRERFFFLRRKSGHQNIASQRWVESGGRVRYLGEWHTHPESIPNPSILDLQEWESSAKRRADKRPQVGLIVGFDALHVELIDHTGSRTVCQPVY
jgi:integrative and conjugative element protein (TIGR02256 family)